MPQPEHKNLQASFRAALHGISDAIVHEPAFKYMLIAALAVAAAVIVFDLSRTERAILVILVFAVLTLELINTLFERTLDIIEPEYDERVRRIKDLMASLVLLASAGAAILGLIILWPHIRR